MYEYLEGRLASRSAARLVVDAGGVGYDIAVPVGADFRPREDGTVRAWVHLVVRDDAHLLYGFPDRPTRELFRLLLKVRGVGPGAGLGLLSGLRREELLEAVVQGDSARLQRVKGIGRKTAEQILLDLGDRADALFGDAADALVPAAAAPAPTSSVEDAVSALVSIGYSEKEARKSVDRAAKKVDAADLELLVRTALET